MSNQPIGTTASGSHDWLQGLKVAVVYGTSSFFAGAAIQALLGISGTLPTVAPFIAGLATVAGVAYGFADGAQLA